MPTENIEKLTFSLRETGERLGVSYDLVYAAVRAGKLNVIAGLREMRVSVMEIQRFVETTTVREPKNHGPKKKVAACAA